MRIGFESVEKIFLDSLERRLRIAICQANLT